MVYYYLRSRLPKERRKRIRVGRGEPVLLPVSPVFKRVPERGEGPFPRAEPGGREACLIASRVDVPRPAGEMRSHGEKRAAEKKNSSRDRARGDCGRGARRAAGLPRSAREIRVRRRSLARFAILLRSRARHFGGRRAAGGRPRFQPAVSRVSRRRFQALRRGADGAPHRAVRARSLHDRARLRRGRETGRGSEKGEAVRGGHGDRGGGDDAALPAVRPV